jgi:hypothetical protein
MNASLHLFIFLPPSPPPSLPLLLFPGEVGADGEQIARRKKKKPAEGAVGSTAKNLLYDQLSLPEVGSKGGKVGRVGGKEERREGFLGRRDRHASVPIRGERLSGPGAICLCALSLMALFYSSSLSLPPFLPSSLLLSLSLFLSSSLRRKSPRWWLSAGVGPLARPNCCDSFSTLLTWGVGLVRRGGGRRGGREEGGKVSAREDVVKR